MDVAENPEVPDQDADRRCGQEARDGPVSPEVLGRDADRRGYPRQSPDRLGR